MRRYTPPALAALAAAALLTAACADVASGPTRLRATAGPLRVKDRTTEGSAQLLACAPPAAEERAVAVVGPLGGTVRLGNSSVHVPAGALLDATVLEIVAPASAVVEYEIHALGVSHFLFERPVTVTLDYKRCAAELPGNAKGEGVYLRRGPYEVLEHMGGTLDRDAHTLTFTTGHLSGYAVAF